tara:strand:- start:5295 stop:5471 length:177 start_codon:yes stop_codon:yes gene_type:complete
MRTINEKEVAELVAKLVAQAKELEALLEEGTLTGGTARLPLLKIENIAVGIRRELPQF